MALEADPVRQLIRTSLAERHLNMSSVSKKLGKNHAYLHQFLDRGIPGQLPELVREQLAEILQVPESQLKGSASLAKGARTMRVGAPLGSGDRIPVMGGGPVSSEGSFAWNGEIVDYIARTPHVAGATQAYAFYVAGASMEPRYYAGELVYVHPGKPVTPGAFVLVQLRSDAEGEAPRAFIKRFAKRTATRVTFEQFNPPKEADVKASDIVSMHRIVGSAESSGL